MDELSEAAKSLIERVNLEDAPAPDLAEQSWGVFQTRLTQQAVSEDEEDAAPLASPTAASPGSEPGARRWVGVAVMALALATAASLAWWLMQTPPRAEDPSKTSAATPQPGARAPARPPASTPSSERVSKAEVHEDPVELLQRAETALRAGDGAAALTALERHAEIAPLDPQTDLRMVLRIEALCALGRHDDARAEANAFATRKADAKLGARVARSCAG